MDLDALHVCALVEFEWDEEKAATNLRKHGVDLADAALVFEDDLGLTMADLSLDGEQRFVALGVDQQPARSAATSR